MKNISFNYNGEKHNVVFIVYRDGIPYNVITISGKYKRVSFWQFRQHHLYEDYIMYYCSESGVSTKTIYGHSYVEGTKGVTYWIAKKMRISKRHPMINCTQLEMPLELTSKCSNEKTYNPFEVGEEVGKTTYCEYCEGHYDENHCPEHVEWDDDLDSLVYISHRGIAD